MIGRGALLFLHGSGGNGSEVLSYLQSLPISSFQYQTFGRVLETLNIDLYTPTAKVRRYTAMGGERMNVWFDRSANFITEGLSSEEDVYGIDQSIDFLRSHIDRIHQENPFDYLILGGFSMGGGLSLHSYRKEIHPKLQAVFVLSSFAVDSSGLFNEPLSSHRNLPLLMLHGEDDGLIACEWGRKTSASLLLRDIDVTFRTYAGVDHEISPEELGDLLQWIQLLKNRSLSEDARQSERQTRLESKMNHIERDLRSGQKGGATSMDIDSDIEEEGKRELVGYTTIPECLPFKILSTQGADSTQWVLFKINSEL